MQCQQIHPTYIKLICHVYRCIEGGKKSVVRHKPVSTGGAAVFSGPNMHKQTMSNEMMAMNSMPAPIPRMRIRFECLPLFEELSDVEGGE